MNGESPATTTVRCGGCGYTVGTVERCTECGWHGTCTGQASLRGLEAWLVLLVGSSVVAFGDGVFWWLAALGQLGPSGMLDRALMVPTGWRIHYLLVLLSVPVPLVVVALRQRFLALAPSRQWAIAAVPIAFFLLQCWLTVR